MTGAFKKRAKAPRKTGPGAGLCVEGFFRLDFLFLLCQDKRTSPRGNERARTLHLTQSIFTTSVSRGLPRFARNDGWWLIARIHVKLLCSIKVYYFWAHKINNMNFPAELKYTKDHEWIKVEGNVATIGITEFAQRELGDIVYVDIPSVGKTINKDDVFGTVDETNPALDSQPELVNSDPYGAGWMVKVTVDPADVEGLLSADAYKAIIGE